MIICGMPGSTPSNARMAATGVQAAAEPNWLDIWPVRSSGEETRVTMTSAAIDSISAGTCATRPSPRSEEHTSELQSLKRISYAVFCMKKNKMKEKTKTQSDRQISTTTNIE